MLRDEDKWPAMHAYRKAVSMDEAPAILCPEDQAELVPVVGRRSDPALKCLSCNIVFEIGLNTWKQIEANISEVAQAFRDRDNIE